MWTSASTSRSSEPVQRTDSSPSGDIWSKATAFSRNSSSSARKRATLVSVSGASPHSARKVIVPTRRSRSTMISACSRTLTAGAWMCWSEISSSGLGSRALAASAANASRPIPISTSGSSPAYRSSRPTARGCRRDSPASRCSRTAATCLNARYCSRRAKSRSRASSSARSSSSSTSPWGSSRADLRSSRVEATTRNDVVCSRSQAPSTPSTRAPAFTCAMNSSVTRDSETSVMSSLCLAIRLSSRSKGPSKLSSRTSKPASVPTSGPAVSVIQGSLLDEPLDEQAVEAVLLEVGEHDRDRLAHHPAPVDREPVLAPEGQPCRPRGRAARRR